MFWWIVLILVVVGFAFAWWSSGRQISGVDEAKVRHIRKINEGRGSGYDGGGGG